MGATSTIESNKEKRIAFKLINQRREQKSKAQIEKWSNLFEIEQAKFKSGQLKTDTEKKKWFRYTAPIYRNVVKTKYTMELAASYCKLHQEIQAFLDVLLVNLTSEQKSSIISVLSTTKVDIAEEETPVS